MLSFVSGNLDKHLRTHDKNTSNSNVPGNNAKKYKISEMIRKSASENKEVPKFIYPQLTYLGNSDINVVPRNVDDTSTDLQERDAKELMSGTNPDGSGELVLSMLPSSCGETVTRKDKNVDHVAGSELNLNISNVWCYQQLEQQERAAVETIQQWQMKGFEVIQGAENLTQLQNVTPIYSTVLTQNTGSVQTSQAENPTGGQMVYVMKNQESNGGNGEQITDVIASATASAGIQVVYPETSISKSNNKTENPRHWKDDQRLPSGVTFYHPVNSHMLPKLPEIGSLQWQQITQKKNSAGTLPTAVHQPIYAQLKAGEHIIKLSDNVPVNWMTAECSDIPPNNHIVLQNYQGNIMPL